MTRRWRSKLVEVFFPVRSLTEASRFKLSRLGLNLLRDGGGNKMENHWRELRYDITSRKLNSLKAVTRYTIGRSLDLCVLRRPWTCSRLHENTNTDGNVDGKADADVHSPRIRPLVRPVRSASFLEASDLRHRSRRALHRAYPFLGSLCVSQLAVGH